MNKNSNKVLISDLDKTLIFSDKNKEFCKDKKNICVEYKNGEPMSYMSKKAYKIFKSLIKNNVIFVPCTMRSFQQLNRIDLIKELNPKYLICYNGCELYIDGQLNKEYEEYIEKFLDTKGINRLYNDYKNKHTNLRVTSFNDYYFEIKATNKSEKNNILEEINRNLDFSKYKIFTVSFKIYIMPKNIDKLNAFKYLEENFLKGTYFGMGDSLVDENFINHCFHSFVPGNVEFKPKFKNTYCSKKTLIHGGEDILNKLNSVLN